MEIDKFKKLATSEQVENMRTQLIRELLSVQPMIKREAEQITKNNTEIKKSINSIIVFSFTLVAIIIAILSVGMLLIYKKLTALGL